MARKFALKHTGSVDENFEQQQLHDEEGDGDLWADSGASTPSLPQPPGARSGETVTQVTLHVSNASDNESNSEPDGETSGSLKASPENEVRSESFRFDVGSINRVALRGNSFRQGHDVHHNFAWCEDDMLGSGTFGKVFQGRSLSCKRKVVAIKQVAKKGIADLDGLYAEIQVLCDLDHPNVLRFLESYSDAQNVYIVTEVCLGGSLQEKAPCFRGNVAFAKRVTAEITGALAHCHERQICHRDLKLDNVLLLRDHVESVVRIADFGLAKRCSRRVRERRAEWVKARARNTRGWLYSSESSTATDSDDGSGIIACIKSVKGTPGYMAPEVMELLDAEVNNKYWKSQGLFYDFRCDVWSLGCIVFALIDGGLPYSVSDIASHVSEGEPLPKLRTAAFRATAGASDFVEQCLQPSFERRPHALELLKHEWLLPTEGMCPTRTSARDVIRRLRAYTQLSQLKRAALIAAVRYLGAYEQEELRVLFEKVSASHTGCVSTCDLRRTSAISGAAGEHEEPEDQCLVAEDIIRVLDSEGRGTIDFTDFLAAVMDHKIEDRCDLASAAFQCFDVNCDGFISRVELKHVLGGTVADDIFDSCQVADERGIDFQGFLGLLRSG